MPCVETSKEQIEEMVFIIEANPQIEIIIDIENKAITVGEKTYKVSIKDSARSALISGRWDPLQELLENDSGISETVEKLPYVSHAY